MPFLKNLSFFYFTDYFDNTCFAFFNALSDTVSAFVVLSAFVILSNHVLSNLFLFSYCTTQIIKFPIKTFFGNDNA